MHKKNRDILLIEPGYRNKYPPIGLMKIATYHRMLGDKIVFFKGDPLALALKELVSVCLKKLNKLNDSVAWSNYRSEIAQYLRTRKKRVLTLDVFNDEHGLNPIAKLLKEYADIYHKRNFSILTKYDRIYVTTLFTFYWDITVRTIENSKLLVKKDGEIKVGGVLASLLASELEATTGIKPLTGLLDKPKILDDNDIVVDDLPLDYSILDETDYEYPTGSAYFTFMTKGCTRTCTFCSVPKLEPTYKEKVPTSEKFYEIKKLYGDQQHLLLMDNNVLASPKFPEIIAEIKEMGFTKGAKFVEPNQLDIAIHNLRKGLNNRAYVHRAYKLLSDFSKKRVKGKVAEDFHGILEKFDLLDRESARKKNLLEAYKQIKEIYETHRNKSPKLRFVDFNQGTDARYVTDAHMKLLSEIPIYPLRIAFDHISLQKVYTNAVRLAAKYGITRLSNYLLFNFNDRPEDLYNRMNINVELSEELNIHIYSFPMKYIPLFGEEAKHRRYIGKHWNKKFIRTVQAISNATRGIVPAGTDFFQRAYGKNIDEFMEILYMPEEYIIFRKLFDEELGYASEWRNLFNDLRPGEKELAKRIIEANDFVDVKKKTRSRRLLRLLRHYQVRRSNIGKIDIEYLDTKSQFNDLIKQDRFINLTLTYDYDNVVSL